MNAQDIRDTNLFDSYLNNELTDSEKQQFETRLKQEVSFRTAFELHQGLIQLLNGAGKTQLKMLYDIANFEAQIAEEQQALFEAYRSKRMKKVDRKTFEQRLKKEGLLAYEWKRYKTKQVKQSTITTRRSIIGFTKAAAVILVLIVAGYLGLSWHNQQQTNQLANDFYERPNIEYLTNENVVIRGEGTEDSSKVLEKATTAYKKQKNKLALKYLNQYVKQAKANDKTYYAYLFIGAIYFEQGDYERAIEVYKVGRDGIKDTINYTVRIEAIRLRLALAYLKNGQRTKAIKELEYLSDKGRVGITQDKAKELLNQLDAK